MRKWAVLFGVAAPLVSAATIAHAADEKLVCVAAADAAQQQRSAGKLQQARGSLQICARDVCPAIVRTDCTRWREEVEASMPTIVLRAQDPHGRDLGDVKVWIDGNPVADKIDGLPIEIDPGQHALTAEHAGSKKLRQEVVIRTGDRNRPVSLLLEDVEAPPVPAAPPPVPTRTKPAAWVFAGLSVAAAGAGTYFGLTVIADKDRLERECKPHCTTSQVDDVSRKRDFADIAFGAAILSAGVATYFFITPSRPRSTTLPGREVLVTPMLGGGAAASWVERF